VVREGKGGDGLVGEEEGLWVRAHQEGAAVEVDQDGRCGRHVSGLASLLVPQSSGAEAGVRRPRN
jgi:hypothetical protein